MSELEPVCPLLCKPVLKSKIWGGRKIETELGIALPEGEAIGEAWIVADLKEGASTVVGGPHDGKSLSEVTRLWGERMIGSAWEGKPTGGRFPLLIKFLDAADDLSVQVHPDGEACRRDFPDDFSKDESWIVLQADPGGSILHGFEPDATLESFDRLLAEGRVVECMRQIEVAPGQVYRVAPRTVHALRAGVLILEIQEPSDSTFRIYDYDRPGTDGLPRPLHLEASRKVMRFGDETPAEAPPRRVPATWGEHEILVDVPAYRIERLRVHSAIEWTVDPRSAQVLILLEGRLCLESGGTSLDLKPGDAAVLPAALGAARIHPAPGPAPRCILTGAGGVPLIAAARD